MPAANIKINGVAASDFDAVIATLVNLDNANVGGETTYLWEFVDQPDGAADSFSNAAIQNPTLTPNKEGTYLIRLTVNQGQGVLEKVDVKKLVVLHLKTRDVWPAAGETTQNGADGWKDETNGLNETIKAQSNRAADPHLIVCKVNAIAGLGAGHCGHVDNLQVIKSGLPGQETIPGLSYIDATDPVAAHGLILVSDHTVKVGDTFANGHLIWARMAGVAPTTIAVPGGVTVSPSHPVWLSDIGVASLTPGTYPRRIGRVCDVTGGNASWVMEPQGGNGRRTKLGPGLASDWTGAGKWTRQTIGAIMGWGTSDSSAVTLYVPLDLAVGEILYKLACRVKQADATGLVDIHLCSADVTGAETVVSSVTSDASTANKEVAVAMPHDATKAFDYLEILADVSYYLRIDANGGNTHLRVVGSTETVVLPPGSKPG